MEPWTIIAAILGSNVVTAAVTGWVARRNGRDSTENTSMSTVISALQEASEADRALIVAERARADEERVRAEAERTQRRAWERFGESVLRGVRDGTMPPWPDFPTAQNGSGSGPSHLGG